MNSPTFMKGSRHLNLFALNIPLTYLWFSLQTKLIGIALLKLLRTPLINAKVFWSEMR